MAELSRILVDLKRDVPLPDPLDDELSCWALFEAAAEPATPPPTAAPITTIIAIARTIQNTFLRMPHIVPGGFFSFISSVTTAGDPSLSFGA